MNYYSRNSPVKNKRNLPPGFLLARKSYISTQNTPRPLSKSIFSRSDRNTPRGDTSSFVENSQMLILDADCDYVPDHDQILIQDEQDEESESDEQAQKKEVKRGLNFGQILQDKENSSQDSKTQRLETNKISPNYNKQPNQQETLRYKDAQQKTQNVVKQQQKQFFRNYSFGDKQFASERSSGSLKQPLIYRVINSQSLFQVSKIVKQNNQKVKEERIVMEANKEEPWSRLVKNFIKKREQKRHSSQQKSDQIQESEWIKAEDPVDQEDVQSHGTGYFRGSSEQSLHGQNRLQQQKRRKQSIRIQEDEYQQSECNKVTSKTGEIFTQIDEVEQNYHYEEDQELRVGDGYAKQQPLISFNNSNSLLSEAMHQLPEKLLPMYEKISQQLVRKQIQSQMTMKRMQETQEMMSLLIESYRKYFYVDDYLLMQGKSSKEERVAMNREIILSLIRQLAQSS